MSCGIAPAEPATRVPCVSYLFRVPTPSVAAEFAIRAPTRIDFGGGWTDVPPYDVEQGGFVWHVAISRYATAQFSPLDDPAADPQLMVQREGDRALLRAVARKYDVRGAR